MCRTGPTVDLKPFDAADYLDAPERVRAFLEEAIAENDPAFLAKALGIAARARGLSATPIPPGPSEAGGPGLATLLAILDALGLQLALRAKADAA